MATMETRLLRALREQKRKPIAAKELAKKIGLRKADKEAFGRALDALKEQNRLMEKNGKVILAENLGLTAAEIVKVTGTFGFARPAGADRDVFIPGRMLAGALPGDTVLIRITRGAGELPEGEVYKITSEAVQRFPAVLELAPDGAARVHPDRYLKFPLRLAPGKLHGAKDGDKVLCEIARRGERHSEHRARILRAFGAADSAAACCGAILAANGIGETFPPEALEQARAIAAGEGIHPKELAARLDLRGDVVFTIDGADSKDLDDAVSLRCLPEGWELGVHIADVSYYVTHQSPLDREAMERGTSVYYADFVVPMLPPELSNGICSLNPGEDRLAFSALIRLGEDGKALGSRFVKTVIRSRVKGVYGEVNAIFSGGADAALLGKYEGLTESLEEMRRLAAILTANRVRRGSVNLETAESMIVLDENGVAADVLPRERGVAETIIEEFMLTANEAAATLALEKKLPFVYRVHESPAPDKVFELYEALEALGVGVQRPRAGVAPGQLAGVLDKVRGAAIEPVVNTMVLRTMAKARYDERNTGHFGLALDNYAHFTSPIRRYPDLAIHRILSGYVTGMKRENIEKRFGRFVGESAKRSSEREVAAMTAERGCEDCYKAEYMRSRIGEEMEGVVSSVAAFGIYVRLPNTVEGLVHVSAFPDGQWQADGSLYFVERVTGKRLRIGDTVRVRVTGADVSAGTVDFALANPHNPPA